jgi:hypothetical protein
MNMDVQTRVRDLTAHLPNGTKRTRVQANLTAFLNKLDEIPNDSEKISDSREPYQDDESDGVPVVTLEQFNAVQVAKVANLKTLHFDDDGVEITEGAINERGRYGYTALHRAVLEHDVAAVKDLLGQGARTDLCDNSGMTPIQKARLEGYKDLVTILRTNR